MCSPAQTSPLNVRRIGGVTMAENHISTRPTLARKPHSYKVDEGLVVRFLCHANSTHVLQTLWRGLRPRVVLKDGVCVDIACNPKPVVVYSEGHNGGTGMPYARDPKELRLCAPR